MSLRTHKDRVTGMREFKKDGIDTVRYSLHDEEPIVERKGVTHTPLAEVKVLPTGEMEGKLFMAPKYFKKGNRWHNLNYVDVTKTEWEREMNGRS